MQQLLRRHYGTSAILRQVSRPSAARRSLRAYLEGDLDAVTCLPTATDGTDFQRTVWDALRRIPVGHTITAPWRSRSASRQRRAPWGSQMAPIPSPSSFLPSGDRGKRLVDRLWRGPRPQAMAAGARERLLTTRRAVPPGPSPVTAATEPCTNERKSAWFLRIFLFRHSEAQALDVIRRPSC